MQPSLAILSCLAITTLALRASADDLLFQYQADVHPTEGGFQLFDACNAPDCSENLQDGYFAVEWLSFNDFVNYDRTISRDPEPAPATLWTEWRFRSNVPQTGVGCDGRADQVYRGIADGVDLHGDAVVSFEGGDFITGLTVNTFYTLRFESFDGENYTYGVDGRILLTDFDSKPAFIRSYLQFGGNGSCARPSGSVLRNEWDFVRYGTLSTGETVIGSDPPSGIVDAGEYPDLDHFTVTFDQPGFVYVDDVAVSVTPLNPPLARGEIALVGAPQVLWVKRPDNSEPDTVQIVLDQPIPLNATTTFTFETGGAPNVVAYTYVELGACCLTDATCANTDESACVAAGGTFNHASDCEGDAGRRR